MNVLMIGPSRQSMGGISTVINNFSKYFNDDNIKIIYFESWKEGKFLSRLINSIVVNFKLIYLIKKNKVDLAHLHVAQKGSFYRKSILVIILKLFKIKVVFHIHGSSFDKFYENSNHFIKKYISFILNISDEIIVLSEEWERFVSKITKSNINIFHNAVKIESKNYNSNGNSITFLGRLCERKGLYDLLPVLKELNLKQKDLKVYLCGDGDINEAKKFIEENNISENVIVTGWISAEQKKVILKDTIINLLPSYHEGMPMAILETMSLGIPNISTNIGGIPQVINSMEDGIIINPGDKENLKNSIELLIENKELRNTMSTNSYNKIYTNYSIESYNKKISELYNFIIQRA